MDSKHGLLLIALNIVLLMISGSCRSTGNVQASEPKIAQITKLPVNNKQTMQQPPQGVDSIHESHLLNPEAVEVIPPGMQITESPNEQTNVLPEQHFIWNIRGHRQYFGIGCEASAVCDWASYFGVEILESNFQFQLPASDNPDFGFVGNVTDPWGQVPPYSYGVHAYPVANLLRSRYGMNARGIKHFTIDELKQEIAANRPVIAWVIGNVVGGVPFLYTDKEGRQVIVAAYEHVVIITGYTHEKVRYMNNGRFYDIPLETFENSWKVLENMVVVLEE